MGRKLTRAEAGRLGAQAAKRNGTLGGPNKQIAIDRFIELSKRCQACDEPITYDKRINLFCNHHCRANFHARPNPDAPCVGGCGTPVSQKWYSDGKRRTYKQRYCSSGCSSKHKQLLGFAEIRKSGKCDSAVRARKFLANESGYKCSVCSRCKWQDKKLDLELDHIDGNGMNNKLENLRLICPNCHSQTPTYKGRNAGKGRVARRERAKRDYHRAK